MSELSQYAVDLLLEGREGDAREALLAESAELNMLKQIGETQMMDYLLKFEQYLDEHDIYLFDKPGVKGWTDGMIQHRPKISDYWVVIYMTVPKTTDLRAATRLIGDKEAQNEVKYKQNEDGSYLIKFRILRRLLDKIEQANKMRAEEIADREDPTMDPDKA